MAEKSFPLAKLVGVAAGLAAAWAAEKVIDSVWKRTTGYSISETDEENSPLGEVALATVVTGALVAVSRLLAMRGAARVAARYLRH